MTPSKRQCAVGCDPVSRSQLPDERRETYLKQVHDLAQERKPVLARTPIVFEGDAPAELARNPVLAPLIEAPAWPASPRSA